MSSQPKMVLDEKDLLPDPVKQFALWFHDAQNAVRSDPTAMTLATASSNGVPSARIVLLKSFDDQGFVFYTNYGSRKSDELLQNPHAALLGYWTELYRQVRLEGRVEQTSREESERYFRSRPRESQLGAWASQQSRVIESREALDRAYADMEKKFGDGEIPLPPFWGGFRLIPRVFEFWQSRENRLHDRILYTRESNRWKIERLCP
jgi:pyridoxamine 5'-phosphate oxidase